MNLTQTVFFDRAVGIGARLLTAAVYANFYDRLCEDGLEGNLPYASMGADWCDCLPDWPGILMPASLEMAMFLQDLSRATGERSSCVPDLLGDLCRENEHHVPSPYREACELDWDRWLSDLPVPDRGPTALDFMINNLVLDAMGTGCGIRDCGWSWPSSWLPVINYRFEDLDFEAWFPDWEKRQKERV